MTTNVPSATFGPTGYISPSESAVLAGVFQDIQAAYTLGGYTLNPSLKTPQGQLASSMSAIIGNVNDTFQYQSTQTDPAFAVGRWQDAIGRIYYINRNTALATVVQCLCIGVSGVVIPEGTLAQDTSQNIYVCLATTEIPASGSVTVPFANTIPGPTPCSPNTLNIIYQGVSGWDSINNPLAGVIGTNAEGSQAFEQRRSLSTANNSIGFLGAVRGALLAQVPGLTQAFVTQNDTNSPITVKGFTLQANSFYAVVIGGSAQDIAQTLMTKKSPGCSWNGSTNVTVYDQQSGYIPPYPAYSVSFDYASPIAIFVNVTIVNTSAVPSNADTLIQNAIINAFQPPVALIATDLVAGSLYPPVQALGSWVQLESIQIGSLNASGCVFSGSISGTTLTVGSVSSGALAIGQWVVDGTGAITPGTRIVSGSGSSWQVSNSQTVGVEAMYGVAANINIVGINLNQIPVTAVPYINVTAVNPT